MENDVAFFHNVIEEWIAMPDVAVVCGNWKDGSISEIIAGPGARLLPAAYSDCFAGVRELRVADAPHHLHIDLARIHRIQYAVHPSVCLQFKPSFEVRFLLIGAGGAPTDRWCFSCMLTHPYRGDLADKDSVTEYFRIARRHLTSRRDVVEIDIARSVTQAPGFHRILDCLNSAFEVQVDATAVSSFLDSLSSPVDTRSVQTDPPCLQLLSESLKLTEASLVLFRDRLLVEFQTESLGPVLRYEEAGHVSWQIGETSDHHCHLALGAVTKVLFSAEEVPCQGGGLNYTIWFLTPGHSGNPYRRDGYFSVVLNSPYEGIAPRKAVIEPVLDLYRAYRDREWVSADEKFLDVVKNGPPVRRQLEELHASAE